MGPNQAAAEENHWVVAGSIKIDVTPKYNRGLVQVQDGSASLMSPTKTRPQTRCLIVGKILEKRRQVGRMIGIITLTHYGLCALMKESCMNFIIWNCNGASSNRFIRTLWDVINMHKPILLGLLETKCSRGQADKICNSLGFDYWCRVEALGLSGGIWLLYMEGMRRPPYHKNPSTVYTC